MKRHISDAIYACCALRTMLLVAFTLNSNASSESHKSRHNGLFESVQGKRSQPTYNEAAYIQGPKSLDDRIAIVGAGPAGIHMAVLLKDEGYKNIEIFEQGARIGGKAMTVFHNNAPQELGACCMGPGYESNVIELIKRFAPTELVPREIVSVWLDNLDAPISYGEYIIRESMKHFQTYNATVAVLKLIQVMQRYVIQHRQLFGDYEFELMPRPSAAVLSNCKGSFLDFLKRNDMEALVSLLIVSHTLQGYDYLEEIGAVYGLMWNPPALINGLLAIVSGDPTPRTFLTKSGFQTLWETVAKKSDLQIHFNLKIRSVIRTAKDISICKWNGDTCYKHDFVIWSPELKNSLQFFKPWSREEQGLFGTMKSSYLITSLVDVEGGIHASTATEYWLDSLTNKRDQTVYAVRNSFESLNTNNRSPISMASGPGLRSVIAYQYSRTRPCMERTKRLVYRHFRDRMASKVKVVEHRIWKYFPHFSPHETVNGKLWDILQIQGKRKMWYIGSSVSFESLKSVMEYNKLLVSKMRPLGR